MKAPHIPRWIGWPILAVWAYFVLAFFGHHMLYHPSRHPEGPWDLRQVLQAEDVWLTAADGVRIHGWFVPPAPATAHRAESLNAPAGFSGAAGSNEDIVTLYLHGNAGNLTHRFDKLSALARAGTSVLIIDYRGFGRSEGSPKEHGLYLDADAAYDELLRRGFSSERIFLYGESLGTGVATDLAARKPCAGLVLEAPFPSVGAVANRIVPVIGPLVVSGFDTENKIRRVKAPLLILHGTSDEVIRFEFGEAVFAAANEPKEFWIIEGGHHNDLVQLAGPEFTGRLEEFFSGARGPVSPP